MFSIEWPPSSNNHSALRPHTFHHNTTHFMATLLLKIIQLNKFICLIVAVPLKARSIHLSDIYLINCFTDAENFSPVFH